MGMLEKSNGEQSFRSQNMPRYECLSSMDCHEETEYTGVMLPKGLLDLPIDILQQVIAHTTHTNDLCALALTHSSLHRLVVPYIYSRFDIVWPEANPTVESRVGVDALTYGLATLVMAHDVFGEASHQQQCRSCQHCDEHKASRQYLQSSDLPMRIRRGNYFAHFTRKFSLGNGPHDWVSEYLISKEGGKMLGTLVALALGRMRNLETFVWDMPTGVLRDVWIALASLANRADGQGCRLEKVWVRWHDNRDGPHLPPGGSVRQSLPSLQQGTASSLFDIPPYPSVEFPTFSILPPLKSISVLDIDEVPYVEELSVLLERSLDRLRELRVGVAAHAQRDLPFRPVDDRSVVPPSFVTHTDTIQPGGLIGILFGRFGSSLLTAAVPMSSRPLLRPVAGHQSLFKENTRSVSMPASVDLDRQHSHFGVDQLGVMMADHSLQDEQGGMVVGAAELTHDSTISGYRANPQTPRIQSMANVTVVDQLARQTARRKLQLSIFELERLYLSIPILSRSIDWCRLESLTLLSCMNHEELWKALRRTFSPPSFRSRTPTSRLNSALGRQRSSSSVISSVDPSDFKLKIRRLHTDTVSRALLDFMKYTLQPDTLEWLFLQQSPAYRSNVEIEDIYRCAVRRHKHSLRKLLIDSELRNLPRHEREREREDDSNWKKWALNQDLITCITSGKMQLRELSMTVPHDGWHYFLKRLPNLPTLRSLHISHITSHPFGRQYDREEIARSILNIIAVRPEIELCYFGIEKKCYEILQYDPAVPRHATAESNRLGTIAVTTHMTVEDEDEEDVDHDDGGAAHHMNNFAAPDLSDDEDNDNTSSNVSSKVDDSDDEELPDEPQKQIPEFTLREILFYDDKISIFKARHGKL